MENNLLILIFLGVNMFLLVALLMRSKKSNPNQDVYIEKLLKEGFADTRREARELNAENRKEINMLFTSFQDTLLKRVSENISLQKEQLASFSRSLTELSDKLLLNFTHFKENLNETTQKSNQAIINKQTEFIDKTLNKFTDFEELIKKDAAANRKELTDGLKSFEQIFANNIKDFSEKLTQNFSELNKQQLHFNQQSTERIKEIKEGVEKHLKSIREDNTNQLTEMRKTVDEKLQSTLEKRLGESFKQVSERLELVHKGLGEMHNLATGVGDLKKVLSNVKTRGILGEYQLENILEQILTVEQYDKNVATKKGSMANVEFAIKLPGKEDNDMVYLPVDSKFPMEGYQALVDAYEAGVPETIEWAQKGLIKSIEGFAREISSKYIDPPNTTDFAIMFLPVESLYAEVLRHTGVFEKLQRDFHVTVTGPTTLSAVLNSLSMGFRTLAVQKRSSEVWKVLGAVKTEFNKFSDHLAKVHNQINVASNTMELIRSTRTNVMIRKLKSIESMEKSESKNLLEIPENDLDKYQEE